MYFSQIPSQLAPMGRPLIYTLAETNGLPLTVQILNAAGQRLGTKRFAGAEQVAFDAAPCIRSGVRFVPTEGGCGFYPAQSRIRSVSVRVLPDEGEALTAPQRSFVAAADLPEAPAMLSTMPRQRILCPEECDELTLFTAADCSVTVTAQAGGTVEALNYRDPGAGLHLFRLDPRDFAGAQTISVDAGPCGEVVYTIDHAPQRGRRLAWRTHAGSIEHYTFPVEVEESVVVAKSRGYGPDGHFAVRAGEEVRTTLRSAFELREVLQSLAGLLCAPQVWEVRADGYHPVEVLSDTAVTHRYDTVGTFEITLRSVRKNTSPWS